MDFRGRSDEIQEQIDSLVGKLCLKKRDNASLFQKQEEVIKNNAEYILNLRAVIKDLRQELSKAVNKDSEVIEDALSDRRSIQLECKRYDAQTAQKELNEDVCVIKKKLNHFKHQKDCRVRRLKDLQLQFRDTKLLDHSIEKDDQRTVRILSTKLDKMKLKTNTASFINRTYQKTLSSLNSDALTMPTRIDEVKKQLGMSSAELAELEKIHDDAQKRYETSKSQRIAIEREFYSGKHQRDKILKEQKSIVKENSNITDIDTKPSIQVSTRQSEMPRKTALIQEKPTTMLAKLEPVIEIFSSITNAKTAAEIPQAYNLQIENEKNLVEMREKLEKKLILSKEKRAALKKQLSEVQFREKEKSLKADEDIKSLNNSIDTFTLDSIRNSSESRNVAQVISMVQEGLTCLAEKMNNVPDLPRISNISTLTDMEKLKMISKAIDAMRKSIDNDSIGTVSSDSLGEDPIDLLLKTGPNGCRIKVEYLDEDNQIDFLIDDAVMNESYRSYDDVKRGNVKKRKARM